MRSVRLLEDAGVNFVLNAEVGAKISSSPLLEEYDEVQAEEMLQTLLADLKNAPSSELSKMEMEDAARKTQGYHSTMKQ